MTIKFVRNATLRRQHCTGLQRGIYCYVRLDDEGRPASFSPTFSQTSLSLEELNDRPVKNGCRDHFECPESTFCYKGGCLPQVTSTCSQFPIDKSNRYAVCAPLKDFTHECFAGSCVQMCVNDDDCDFLFPGSAGYCSVLKNKHHFGHCKQKINGFPWIYVLIPAIALNVIVILIVLWARKRKPKTLMSEL